MTLRKANRRYVTFTTTEGDLTYRRYCLQAVGDEGKELLRAATGSTTVFPLDEHLGLDRLPFKITCEAAIRMARVAVDASSYADAERVMLEYLGTKVSRTTLQRVTNHIGAIVRGRELARTAEAVASYDSSRVRAGHVRGRIPAGALTLYLQMDGAMSDTAGGGRGEAKLAVCFRSTDLVERRGKDGKPEMRLGAREYACSVGGVDEFRDACVALAIRNGLMEAHNMVIIGDGAPWIRNTRDERFPFAVLILDLYHLKENVGAFAQFLFPGDPERASEWAVTSNDMLEEGRWRDFLELEEVKPYAYRDTSKGVVNIYNYVWNNHDAIDYPTYRSRGYFVGSGAIESANRSVMQRRIKQAGARWYAERAGGVLELRCKLLSGLWESDVASVVRRSYRRPVCGQKNDDGQ